MAELKGFADLHAHLMAHLGYGGKVFWGKPWDPDGISKALAWCTEVHGPGGIAIFSQPEFLHYEAGYPEFNGWPRFTSIVHQQAYIDWIKRAYEAGLRLICCLVTNNELVAERSGGVRGDKLSTEHQIVAMREMVERGPGQGWMEIAGSPQEARRIIIADRLAVVLGVEVDSLGDWRTEADLPADLDEARQVIREEVERLYRKGVRHITPMHFTDNPFGGAAIYNVLFNAVNWVVTGRLYQVEDGWDSGVRYRLDQDYHRGGLLGMLKLGVAFGDVSTILDAERDIPPTYTSCASHINARGLTPYGRILLEEMMRLGMIIDVDHMSEKMTDGALQVAEAAGYPFISSHTGFRELAFTADVPYTSEENQRQYGTSDIYKIAHESMKRSDQIEKIRQLGGIIAPIMGLGDLQDVGLVVPEQAGKVPNDCPGSSKTWAQAYLYAIHKMKGKSVGLASDVGGWVGCPGPRFGTFAAFSIHNDNLRNPQRREQIDRQKNGVKYQGAIKDYRWYRFEDIGPGGYDAEERDIWEAIAIYKAGVNPWVVSPEGPTGEVLFPVRTLWGQEKINNIAKGFWAADEGRELERPALLGGDIYAEQRAAFLVRKGVPPTSDADTDPQRVHELYPRIKAIWEKWNDIEGSNRPLTRCEAGPRRDWDINIDGMAHYGLLPDLLQDLRNVGLTEEDLAPLFRSAEDYVQMWEKCYDLKTAEPPKRVDLNTASFEELLPIIHIGPVRARQIIAYRPWPSVDQLIALKGIGYVRLADIKREGLAVV